MYVTPRPNVDEDPLYAVRFGVTGALAYAAIPLFDPALPPIIAALPVGLIAAQRKAFNPVTAIAGPIALIVLVYIMTWLVELLRPWCWCFQPAGRCFLKRISAYGPRSTAVR